MDPELIVAAILREREAEFARLDRIRRARPRPAATAPVARCPGLLRRVAQAFSPRVRARARKAGCRTLEAGG
jgi:hypothetical protein